MKKTLKLMAALFVGAMFMVYGGMPAGRGARYGAGTE